MIPRLEKDIQRQILYYLRSIGAYAGKVKTMGVRRGKVFCRDPFLMRGMVDVIAFYNGQLYFIEVKSPNGVQSNEQKQFEWECKKAGIPYILAFSVDHVIAFIN